MKRRFVVLRNGKVQRKKTEQRSILPFEAPVIAVAHRDLVVIKPL